MGTENRLIEKIIKTNDDIAEGSKELASRLNKDYENSNGVVFIVILKGALPFSAELIKHITFDNVMDFAQVSSYHLKEQLDSTTIKYEPTVELEGKDIILVEDLVDSGNTIISFSKVLEAYKPNSIAVAAMYGKPTREKLNIEEYYIWDQDPGGFLLGFGLDYDEKYRNLPFIAIIKKEEC